LLTFIHVNKLLRTIFCEVIIRENVNKFNEKDKAQDIYEPEKSLKILILLI